MKDNIFTIGLTFLFSCTISTPFKIKNPEILKENPEKDFVLSITHATLGEDSKKNNKFWENTNQIIKIIEQQKGLIGFSIRRNLLGNQVWTMTAWTSEEELEKFIYGERHSKAIDESYDAMNKTKFSRTKIQGKKIPLSWDEAEKIMYQKEKSY